VLCLSLLSVFLLLLDLFKDAGLLFNSKSLLGFAGISLPLGLFMNFKLLTFELVLELLHLLSIFSNFSLLIMLLTRNHTMSSHFGHDSARVGALS
jgi:hypothetical protein